MVSQGGSNPPSPGSIPRNGNQPVKTHPAIFRNLFFEELKKVFASSQKKKKGEFELCTF